MTPTFIALVVSACLTTTGAHPGRKVCIKDLPIYVPSHNTLTECRSSALREIHSWENLAHSTGINWTDEHFTCKRISQESEED